MRTRLLIIGFIGLIIGCSRPGVELDLENPMTFVVHYPSTKATESSFEAGDTIGVYISEYEDGRPVPLQLGGNYKNNNPVIFDGRRWYASPTIYWGESNYDVFAYYPFLRPNSVDKLDFKVWENQNSPGDGDAPAGYEASDFLYATTKGLTRDSGAIELSFRHLMSCMRVNLIKGEEFHGSIPTDVIVYIHNTVTDSQIDLSTGDVVKNPYAPHRSIIAHKDSDASFSAIVVPQMVEYRKPLVEIVCRGVSYMIESRFHFKTGVRHTFNVTMNDNPEQIKIDIGGEVEGWN